MASFSKIKGFFYKHKNKFLIGGVLITGFFVLTKYAQKRLRDWHEKEALEFIERNRKKSHFESINRTCNQTVLNLSSSLLEKVYRTINTEEIIEGLKQNPDNKLELWDSLKNKVFTKTGCVVYSLVMLVITLKIQLNILGGYLYREPSSLSTHIQEKYLSLCQTFLNSGIEKLSSVIEMEVTKLLKNVTLTKQMSVSDLEAIFWSLQSSLDSNENSPVDHFREYIFTEVPSVTDTVYDNMLRDTADLLESEEVKYLVTHYINTAFVLLGDQLSQFFTQNDVIMTEIKSNNGLSDFVNPFATKKPLAKLIPILNGVLASQSLPHNLMQFLVSNEKLQKLCGNVYESFLI